MAEDMEISLNTIYTRESPRWHIALLFAIRNFLRYFIALTNESSIKNKKVNKNLSRRVTLVGASSQGWGEGCRGNPVLWRVEWACRSIVWIHIMKSSFTGDIKHYASRINNKGKKCKELFAVNYHCSLTLKTEKTVSCAPSSTEALTAAIGVFLFAQHETKTCSRETEMKWKKKAFKNCFVARLVSAISRCV